MDAKSYMIEYVSQHEDEDPTDEEVLLFLESEKERLERELAMDESYLMEGE